MLGRRLQILLDEERYGNLAREAKRRGTSIAYLVREAIDARFGADTRRRSRALRAFLDADDVEVPADPLSLKRQLADERARLA
jgi:hypothetical protein